MRARACREPPRMSELHCSAALGAEVLRARVDSLAVTAQVIAFAAGSITMAVATGNLAMAVAEYWWSSPAVTQSTVQERAEVAVPHYARTESSGAGSVVRR